MRLSGEPYIQHPLEVANILCDMHMDHDTLVAAMLHDVIEDTGIPKDALAEQFGDDVADLVDGVSKLTQIEFRSRAEAQAENFQKMTLAMARDIRVILVKLADRLHNMRTLGPMPYEKRQRIATETLDIYAPIANRLGMHSICTELEDLGFTSLYPMRSKYISKAVDKLRGSHREIIEDIRGKLQEKLEERGLPGRILGREKHLNSIYNKMKFKQKSFHEIMDVYAFRIITDTEDDCYRILGAVHSLYKPLPGRFKDYIAMPKANGYQSLHTTLFGMHVNIEIQIRTCRVGRQAVVRVRVDVHVLESLVIVSAHEHVGTQHRLVLHVFHGVSNRLGIGRACDPGTTCMTCPNICPARPISRSRSGPVISISIARPPPKPENRPDCRTIAIMPGTEKTGP